MIPFRTRRNIEAAARSLLILSARFERSGKAKPWLDPDEPERLGNLLQRLTLERPAVVFVFENLVAEVLRQLDAV